MQSKTVGVLRAMGDLFVGSGRVRLYDRKPETRDAAPGLANQKSPGNRNVQELLHLEQGLSPEVAMMGEHHYLAKLRTTEELD